MSWNQPPEPTLQSRKVAELKKFEWWQLAARALASTLAFTAARTSVWNHIHTFPVAVRISSGVLSYLTACMLLLSFLHHLYTATKQRQQPDWEKKLSDKQRVLFGLPLIHTRPPATQAAPVALETKNAPVPLGPPLRHSQAITSSHSSGREGMQLYATTPPSTPYSGGSRRRTTSPYQTPPAVTTPEQLQQYLDAFDEHTQTATPSPQTLQRESSPSGQYSGRAMFTQPFGVSEQPLHHYRPSLQARGKTGSPLRTDILTPSSQETFEAVLARLRTCPRSLEVWIDRFREWLAAEVVKPLARKLKAAHKEVGSTARQLTWTIELSSLAKPDAGTSNKGLEADEEAQISMLKEALATQLRQPLQELQRKAVLACLQAVQQYQRLTALLRGEHPKDLLPPAPRGYVAARLQALAQGPCLAAYTWNSGGMWQSKPWTTDLLTDSALVLYLFAAYLEAPRWEFPLAETRHSASGAPLYLGSLPSRPAQYCTALLPVRPAALPRGATAVLALGLATREPTITLVLRGEPALTLSSYTAVFVQLLLLIQSCKLDSYGAIGNNSLQYLGLDSVVQPADAPPDAFRIKWFGLW